MQDHVHPDLLDDELSRAAEGAQMCPGQLPLLCPACGARPALIRELSEFSFWNHECTYCGACW
jgi:hypothetical protein